MIRHNPLPLTFGFASLHVSEHACYACTCTCVNFKTPALYCRLLISFVQMCLPQAKIYSLTNPASVVIMTCTCYRNKIDGCGLSDKARL